MELARESYLAIDLGPSNGRVMDRRLRWDGSAFTQAGKILSSSIFTELHLPSGTNGGLKRAIAFGVSLLWEKDKGIN